MGMKNFSEKLPDVEILRESLSELNQTLLEIAHAQRNGPQWYTKGEDGMHQQVSMWLSRGFDALKRIDKTLPDDYKLY